MAGLSLLTTADIYLLAKAVIKIARTTELRNPILVPTFF
jgi:hypothetical protein